MHPFLFQKQEEQHDKYVWLLILFSKCYLHPCPTELIPQVTLCLQLLQYIEHAAASIWDKKSKLLSISLRFSKLQILQLSLVLI